MAGSDKKQSPVSHTVVVSVLPSAGFSARIEAKSTQLVIVFGLAPVRLQFVFRMVILQASDGRMPCVAIETVCRESAGVLRRPTTLHITKY